MGGIWTPDDPQPEPKTFWVLRRIGGYGYVTLDEVHTKGGFARVPGWTNDIKEARHWPTEHLADVDRRSLIHPFWMTETVENARISADAYADGLAEEIGRLRTALEPFARLAERFPTGSVVEISAPHPGNPSPHIEPFNTDHFRRAKALIATGAVDEADGW